VGDNGGSYVEIRRLTKRQLVYVLAASVFMLHAYAADERQIVDQIHRAYYNLAAQGLSELHCRATPEWSALYKQMSVDMEHDKLLPLMKGVHFEVSIGAGGASAVSHQYDTAPPDEQTADRLRQTTNGAEQMLTGFFKTWSPIMFGFSLIGSNDKFEMQKTDAGYRLTQQEGSTRVVMLFTREWMLTDMSTTMGTTEINLHFQFTRGDDGYILTEYYGTFGNTANGQKGDIKVSVAYQQVQGFQIPSTLTAHVQAGAMNAQVPIQFSDCKVTKK